MGRGILRTLARPSTSEDSQRQPSISPTSESKAQQQITQEAVSSEPVAPAKAIIPLSRGRGLASRFGQTVAPLPSGIAPQREREPSVGATITTSSATETQSSLTTRLESVQITETRLKTSVTIEQTPQVPVAAPQSVAPTAASSSADDRARMSTTTSGESRVKYLSVASTGSKSVEKAMTELNVEHVMRSSPVRRAGSDGQTELYATNYVKLKCNNQGVFQYVVNFDPPLDSQRLCTKLIHQMSDVIGAVRLFDGYTLFLPKILDNPTIGTAITKTGEEVKIQIRLTKMLPPEQIPDAIFSIIFKKYQIF
jgi:hypothetical protein